MATGIYKAGQGYWTRMMSLIGGLAVVASLAAWVWGQLGAVNTSFPRVYLQAGVAATLGVLGTVLVYWLVLAKPRTGEFLIATDNEMKKVNWSTRREIIGSTWVVVFLAFALAAIITVVDLAFSRFFVVIGVLEQ